MQNSIQKFRQSSIVSRNQVSYLKNWKFSQAPTTIDFNNFCWNFAHVPYWPLSTKWWVEFFLFCLELAGFYSLTETRFINNSRSKQNKKKSHTPFCRYSSNENVCKVSTKNIKLYGSWSSSKFSIIQTNNLVSWKCKSFV